MRLKKDVEIKKILKLLCPGTALRDGLENILRAKTGALLLITDNNDVLKEVVDGGFTINEDYTSSKLYTSFISCGYAVRGSILIGWIDIDALSILT